MGITGALRSAKHKIERVRYPEASDNRKTWLRQVMNARLDRLISDLDPATLDAVEISGEVHADRPFKSYTQLDWPQFDICDEQRPAPGQWDIVLCEQVMEHVPDPWAGMRTLRRLVKPGGTVVVTTPFLVRLHPSPDDYWRFTPSGMRVLMEQAGLTVVEVDSWGNKQVIRGNLSHWADRRYPWQSLRNRWDNPVVVWGIGRA